VQYNCNSGGWKNISSNKQVCGFTPNTLVNCEIRARRESNSKNNRNSEVATGSVTTPCPAGKYLLDNENKNSFIRQELNKLNKTSNNML